MYQARFSTTTLNLVIAPTMNCNFACTYCYEKNKLNTCQMSEEIQEAVINYIEQYADSIKNLRIEWYGGEPLLATKVIAHLNERILSICLNNKIKCDEEMITNGYLLSREYIEFLNDNRITKIQITLDGTEATHNSRRVHRSGKGTYREIIENLKECKLYYQGSVTLRVNVDKNNISEIDGLVKDLEKEELSNFVNLYLGRVSDTNEDTCNGNCLSCQCFAEQNISFITKNASLKAYLETSYPYPIGNSCAADYDLSMIIAPNGDIYKCHMEIGQKNRAIGNILETDKIEISKIKKTMFFDPTRDEICGKCKYMPICMGGCAKERIGERRLCDYRKYVLDNYLSDISYIEETQGKEEA